MGATFVVDLECAYCGCINLQLSYETDVENNWFKCDECKKKNYIKYKFQAYKRVDK